MAGVGKPKLPPSPISFMGPILKIRFGDVNNFGFQILKVIAAIAIFVSYSPFIEYPSGHPECRLCDCMKQNKNI